uniref:Uncharacterized protein n=1 Tax=Cacopsylla melanoneura TaxID=428564 RepID=A0A8D8TR40_9HEMI
MSKVFKFGLNLSEQFVICDVHNKCNLHYYFDFTMCFQFYLILFSLETQSLTMIHSLLVIDRSDLERKVWYSFSDVNYYHFTRIFMVSLIGTKIKKAYMKA